jgi:hypothetical protein
MRTERHTVIRLNPEPRGAGPSQEDASSGPRVGECLDACHPTLLGRVLVRWPVDGLDEGERWVPTLHGLSVRAGDRVLLLNVNEMPEPIVIGVVDGFVPRPEPARRPGPTVELLADEVLRVQTEDGQSLLEIVRSPEGPVVRLLQSSTRLELPGKLQITASEIELRARQGAVRIEANDDVIVQGEMVRLN